MTLSYRTSN